MRRLTGCLALLLCLAACCACGNEIALIPFDFADVHRVGFMEPPASEDHPQENADLTALFARLAALKRKDVQTHGSYVSKNRMVIQIYCRQGEVYYMLNIYMPDEPTAYDEGYCSLKLITIYGEEIAEQKQEHEIFFFYDPDIYAMIEQIVADRMVS